MFYDAALIDTAAFCLYVGVGTLAVIFFCEFMRQLTRRRDKARQSAELERMHTLQ